VDQLAATFGINPAVAVVVGLFFGLITFSQARRFGQRTGAEPWSIPAVGWGVIGFLIGLLGLILYLIAQGATTRRLGRRAPYVGGTTAPYGVGPPAHPPAGWYTDPSRLHEERYWNGAAWTEHVADGGRPGVDRGQPGPQSGSGPIIPR
jgi:hypothetical protein